MKLMDQMAVKLALLRAARQASESTGKGVVAQLREIRRLRSGPGRLRASDYYAFEVYDDVRYPPAAKREVVSWEGERLARQLNDPQWGAICRDKLVAYGLFKALELPFPEVYAVYSAGRRTFGSVPAFSSPREMAAFLRDGMRYPFFGKYVDGSFGKGASSAHGYDPETDRLRLVGDEPLPVEEYIDRFVVPRPTGYLFQEVIRQASELDRISGGRIATLRLVVLLHDDGPRLFRALWRLPVGSNITDNFDHGAAGNLLAYVGRDSGVVERVVRGSGPASAAADGYGSIGSLVETHPDTGERVRGIRVPGWRESVALSLKAAAAFPGLRYQAWDVVLTDRGPAFLELNSRGSVLQVPGCRGYFDSELAEFVRSYGKGATLRRRA